MLDDLSSDSDDDSISSNAQTPDHPKLIIDGNHSNISRSFSSILCSRE
jgi:hypothetical protein